MDPTASFAAWVEALNHPRDRAYLRAAVADAMEVERHGPVERDQELAAPAEVFAGIDAVERWLRRLPPRVTFAVIGVPIADGAHWRVDYALEVDGFENGGCWVARLADDGRLRHLSHRPFPVPDKYRYVITPRSG